MPASGYTIKKTYKYQECMPAVVYENPSFKKFTFGGGASGGGIAPIN